MPITVDKTVQDANVLLNVVDKYQTQLGEFGVSPDEIASVREQVEALLTADALQKEATNVIRTRTSGQSAKIRESINLIRNIRTAAKAVYGRNAEVLKEFHIGIDIPRIVSKLITELNYMNEVATRQSAELATRGIKDSDLAQMTALAAELTAIDAGQETAKRERVTATADRKTALQSLRDSLFRLRQTAELCFRNSPEILKEFKRL
ncbi:MAG: hypothetical protein JW976_04190 [Syntrophaceae bacterium]|nr:hypothetical protein [Syntrophaceae bacterium]